MKRVVAIGAVLLAASALVVFASGASTDPNRAYRVRAIFENAFSVIPGEDVKVAGVKVGKVDSLDVTPDQKAAVVLRIDRAGFKDFRRDAECTIRPQSLIGEKFVECTPTQPRPDGAPAPPALRRITRGEGRGQYLLPVSQTSRPVDLDLLANVMRLPEQQRLSIILNELGTAVAGRGGELRQAVRNADPALKETDKVLAILGDQNRTLEGLARDSDRIMAPLARDRTQVADFVGRAGTVATATAARDTALEQNIRRLPGFLRQLRPTMTRLGSLSDEMTPVLGDLDGSRPTSTASCSSSGRSRRRPTPRCSGSATRPTWGATRSSGAGRSCRTSRASRARRGPCRPTSSRSRSRCATRAASSARWTTSSTKSPPSTASTRSATTCAPT